MHTKQLEMGDRVLVTNILSRWLRPEVRDELMQSTGSTGQIGSLYSFNEVELKWMVSLDRDVGKHTLLEAGERQMKVEEIKELDSTDCWKVR